MVLAWYPPGEGFTAKPQRAQRDFSVCSCCRENRLHPHPDPLPSRERELSGGISPLWNRGASGIGSDQTKALVFHIISSKNRRFGGLNGYFRPQNRCRKEPRVPEVRTLHFPLKLGAPLLSRPAFPLWLPQNVCSQPLYSQSTCSHDHVSEISMLHPPNTYRILKAL